LPIKILNFFALSTQNAANFFYNLLSAAAYLKKFEYRSNICMASKTPGTPRKTSSLKTSAKPSNPVTLIRESSRSTVENGGTPINSALEEQIRNRAYELYLERGGQDGFDQEDWSRAEREVRTKSLREKSA
jgi:Protein of unknown function (DUF2934)